MPSPLLPPTSSITSIVGLASAIDASRDTPPRAVQPLPPHLSELNESGSGELTPRPPLKMQAGYAAYPGIGSLPIQSLPEKDRAARRDELFAPMEGPRDKEPGLEQLKRRGSEFSWKSGTYYLHRELKVLPVLERDLTANTAEMHYARQALAGIMDELKQDLDVFLAKKGLTTTDELDRKTLVKKVNPYKWIASTDPTARIGGPGDADETKCMLGKSKVANLESPEEDEKMGHVTLVGGSGDPAGRIAGLLYCCKDRTGQYSFVMDNDSGRFSSYASRKKAHVEFVAGQLSQLSGEKIIAKWEDVK